MIKENFVKLHEDSLRENWDLPCYIDHGKPVYYIYGQAAGEIARMHLLFKHCSLRRGDKVAVVDKNNAHWCIACIATITYGAIIVPIPQDFMPSDTHHTVNHSEFVFLFTSGSIRESLEEEKLTGLRGVFSLADFHRLYQRDGETIQKFLVYLNDETYVIYPKGFTRGDIQYAMSSNDRIVLLNYTSGTTGLSKGIMLAGNNLAGDATFGTCAGLLKKGDKILSFPPLAHTCDYAFDFLTATAAGTHVTLLDKASSPKIITKTFEEVKSNLIIIVPLVIKRIYKDVIQPLISKKGMKWALSIPLPDTQAYNRIRKKLMSALDGRLKEIIAGSAIMNQEVEEFFYRIKLPFTIGHGMTECRPLINYTPWSEFILGSSGKVLDIMEARIYKENPEAETGEIQVHGENVMVGYYKNSETTQEVFTEGDQLRTGDPGTMDASGNVFIRERLKSMILNSSGQNTFSEELEAKPNNPPFILESLVIERNKKLVALVYADYEVLDSLGLNNSGNLRTVMDENPENLNNNVATYEEVSKTQLYPTEFEETPGRSIKRYLHNSMAVD